jgi:PHD/YefM family antitoxin component YafN of YafNO toxin-antitoxin module
MGTMLNLSKGIDSLSNFKRNTVRFLEQLRETGEPVVLTINGKAELVVQDAKSYQRLLELAERIETVESIRQGMQELDEGKGISLEEFREHIRRKHNIQR